MDRKALYSAANAYVIQKITAAGSKGYSDKEQTFVITGLSDFLLKTGHCVTAETIKAQIEKIDNMASPGPANVLIAEALEHALEVHDVTSEAARGR